MKYRKFGRLDWKVSALGFGCMRLPTTDKLPMSGNIIESEAISMIRHAIDQGVNYIDTAYPYHGGKSEIVVGKALKDGYREKIKLATKSPVWQIQKSSDFDNFLDEQLKKLETEYIDFYLLHGLNKDRWTGTILKHKVLDQAEGAVKDGRIKHIGFSFHDNYKAFKEIIDGNKKWDFCQIQYNYLDTENQAGTKGLKYAASKGLAVVIMEPLLGGKLANPPVKIKKVFDSLKEKHTPPDLALQWIWNQPEVSVVLSGMNAMEQVEQNLQSADKSGIGTFSPDQFKIIEKLQKVYREMSPIPCTKCGYCMPCPNGVNIPRNFELYNDGFIHEALQTSRGMYSRMLTEDERASKCAQCEECLEKCPQKIKISELMPKVHAVLGEGKPYS